MRLMDENEVVQYPPRASHAMEISHRDRGGDSSKSSHLDRRIQEQGWNSPQRDYVQFVVHEPLMTPACLAVLAGGILIT